MRERIKEILRKINAECEGIQLHPSIVGGEAGVTLFRLMYLKYFNGGRYDEKLADSIQRLAENCFNDSNYSFATGVSGIRWLFSYLYEIEIIDKEDYKEVCANNEFLMSKTLDLLDIKNYEFLEGAVGIVHYLLHLEQKPDALFFKAFLLKLRSLFDNEMSFIQNYDPLKRELDTNAVNVGLAHGVIGVLKVCLEMYDLGITKKEIKSIITKITDFLIANAQSNESICTFPSYYFRNPNVNGSRLGWCYGDLTVGYVLYQAAKSLNDKNLKQFAIKVLKKTTTRRAFADTQVVDVAFCHGSIGIAHIYNKLWKLTKDKTFEKACKFWLLESINGEPYLEGNQTHLKFNNLTQNYEKSYGLLEGSSGYGLGLISYLTGDFSWDYCLMLN